MIELILMTAIIATLAALGAPRLQAALDKANVAGAIHALQLELMQYQAEYGVPPASLAAIARSNLLDPWDNTYQYLWAYPVLVDG